MQRHFGTVKWFKVKERFGFIIPDDKSIQKGDVFVHAAELKKSGIAELRDGQRVSFTIGLFNDKTCAQQIKIEN